MIPMSKHVQLVVFLDNLKRDMILIQTHTTQDGEITLTFAMEIRKERNLHLNLTVQTFSNHMLLDNNRANLLTHLCLWKISLKLFPLTLYNSNRRRKLAFRIWKIKWVRWL